MQREEITRKLVVKLTEAELAERGEEMAQETMKRLRLEFQRSAINRAIKPHKERSEELAAIIEAGEEERSVLCFWLYDWAKNLRFLYREDTGEQIDTELIPDGCRQTGLFQEKTSEEVGMFVGCSSGYGCVYFRAGNVCAPILCGKNIFPPLMVCLPCDHPESERVIESNVITCGICKTVIEAAPITRYPGGAGPVPVGNPEITTPFTSDGNIAPDDEWEVDSLVAEDSGEGEGEGADISAPSTSTPISEPDSDSSTSITYTVADAPNPERTCCLPKDRDVIGESSRRIMCCRECGLVLKIEDTSGPSVANWNRLDVPSFTYVDLKHIRGER